MATVYAAVIGVPSVDGAHTPLRGVGHDVSEWQRCLAHMGVHGTRITVTSGASCTLQHITTAVQRLARQLRRDPEGHALLVLSGHGGEDGALLHTADGALTSAALCTMLDQIVPDHGITVIADVCPVHHPAAQPLALRPIDVVLASAAPGHPAEELELDGQWHGAFTWAAHKVLDRWGSVGPHGSLVAMSPAQLRDQVEKVLDGLGFGQVPTLTGPDKACQASLIAGEHPVVAAPLPAQVVRQFDPGNSGYTNSTLSNSGSAPTVNVVIVGGTKPSGNYNTNTEYWGRRPKDGDTLAVGGTPPGSPPGNSHPQRSFNTASGAQQYNLAPASGDTLLKVLDNAAATVGYVMVKANGTMEWYTAVPFNQTYLPLPCSFKNAASASFSGRKA